MGRYFTNRGGKSGGNYRPILIGTVRGFNEILMFGRLEKFQKPQVLPTTRGTLPRPSGCPATIFEGRKTKELAPTQNIPVAYRLLAVCRNVSAHTVNEFNSTIFTESIMTQGQMQGYIRPYNATFGWRLSPKGYAFLQENGFPYPADQHTQRVGRRFEHAAVASTMLAAAISPFLESLTQLREESGYLPALSLRARKGQNVLGSSQLMGLLRLHTKLFAVYWPVEGGHILIPEREIDSLARLALGANCKDYGIIFCGDSYSSVWSLLNGQYSPERKSRRGKKSYSALYQAAPCECLLLPATGVGAEQLRVLQIPDYPERLNQIFQLAEGSVQHCHAHRNAVNLPVRYGMDMNLEEAVLAARQARAGRYRQLILCALRGQDIFLRHVLRSEGCEVTVLTPAVLEQLYRIGGAP